MEKIIYKYLPLERISYLEDELVRITQPGDLNDPFECLPVPPSIEDISYVLNITLEQRLKEIEKVKISKTDRIALKNENIRLIKKEITKVKQQQDGNFKDKFYKDAVANINAKIGILSLSRRWDSTLMWSHYTNSHKGFCIGFDANQPFFKDYNRLADIEKVFMPVIYDDDRIKIPIEKALRIDPTTMLRKSKDWQYEEEERLLVVFDSKMIKINAKPYDIYLYKVPHPLINEIIIGANFADNQLTKIKEFCYNKGIFLYRSKISNTKFNMEREILIEGKDSH